MTEGQGKGRRDAALFGESGSTFIVAVPEERWEELEDALSEAAGYDWIGTVGGDSIKVGGAIDLKLSDLRKAYERDLFGVPGEVIGGSGAVG